jgi:hypothetical protein
MATHQEWIEEAEYYERRMREDENIDANWQGYLEQKAQACREAACYSREDDPAFKDSLYCSADFYEAEGA